MTDHEKLLKWGRLKWKPKDKPECTLADLDLGYLKNLIPYLKRKVQRWQDEADAAAGFSGGDVAMMEADYAMRHAMDMADRIAFYRRCVKRYVKLREEYNYIKGGPK